MYIVAGNRLAIISSRERATEITRCRRSLLAVISVDNVANVLGAHLPSVNGGRRVRCDV